jgi:hypothetical protein
VFDFAFKPRVRGSVAVGPPVSPGAPKKWRSVVNATPNLTSCSRSLRKSPVWQLRHLDRLELRLL